MFPRHTFLALKVSLVLEKKITYVYKHSRLPSLSSHTHVSTWPMSAVLFTMEEFDLEQGPLLSQIPNLYLILSLFHILLFSLIKNSTLSKFN